MAKKIRSTVKFKTLQVGDFFIEPDSTDGILMKTIETEDSNLAHITAVCVSGEDIGAFFEILPRDEVLLTNEEALIYRNGNDV